MQRPRIPFVIAANGQRSIALAARLGEGWVTTGQPSSETGRWWRSVADATGRFDDALAAAGRDPVQVPRYLSLDASGVFSLTTAAVLADAAGRAAELGFTDVITHWPRPDGPYAGEESVLESVAAELVSPSRN